MLSKNLKFDENFHLIAEIGVNHEGSLENAKNLIKLSKSAGVQSVKLQAYKANTLTTEFAKAYWDTDKEITLNQIDLFKKYDIFEIADYKELSEYAHSLNLQFGLSIFDPAWVSELSHFVDYFKIASADLTCVPLLEVIGSYDKPIILSTGASTLEEIAHAVSILNSNGNNNISLLHCILSYPTAIYDSNLRFLEKIKNRFPHYRIGLSDHVADNETDRFLLARALGVCIIEKHFTNNKNLQGNDHYHSGDTDHFLRITSSIRKADLILGLGDELLGTELAARENARRSIVYSSDLDKGRKIKREDLSFKRPGMGISPTEYRTLLGKELKIDVKYDNFVSIEDFLQN
jgi:N-acetylneuraminate synthase